MKKVFILLISLIAMMAVCLNIKALEATNANTYMDGNAVRTQYSFIYDGNWNDGSNWDTGVVPDPGSDVVIMANVIIPSGYTAIANEVSLLGGSITVADGGQLRHNTPDLVVTMKKNIEPYSNENGWGNYYLLGFPFSENVAVPDAMTAAEGNDFYRFDPKCHDAEWRNNKEQAITIVGGTTGYLYANPESIELSLTGSTYPSYNGEVMTVIVPYTQGSSNSFNGWRLMGNPFTCNAYIYCHNSDNEFVPMDFMVCDPSGELVTISGGPIAPMQGFFVKVTETTTVYIMNHAIPMGAIIGKFTINDMGNKVCFSRGNLQYRASTNTWRFAENQWDCLRLENTNVSSSYDGWIDLFAWGTSGYNHGAVCYQPWSTSTSGSDYYAYGSSEYNLYDQTGKADWGYNAISNGGNTENQWRTLTSDEWSYLLFTRETPSGTRFAKATVNNVEGLVVLPDDWNPIYYDLNEMNSTSANYSANVIDGNDWTNVLETHGAVFLPAGSYRGGASYIEQYNPYKAYYWTSSNVKYFEFNNTQLFVSGRSRDNGLSVRLARPAASSSLPSVITTEVTNITQTTAVCGGVVMDDGGATVTERGVCWSMSHNPTVGGSHASNGTGTGVYTVNMTNLTANTTYYVRAYAKNSAGTAYGEELSFTTLQQPTYIVSVAVYPSYSGTVTGGGTYLSGHSCTVHATAATGYTFVRWTENGSQVSTDANYTFTVTGNRNLVANFAAVQQSYTISVSANPSSGGMVSGGGTYLSGHSCTVHATAATGYTFVRWTENGSQVSTDANYTFTVMGNRSLVAQFQAETYSIVISANPTDGGTVAGGGDYNYGESCTVFATANDGYTFSNWTENGNVVSSTAYYTFAVGGNKTLVANFQPQQYTIITSVNPTNGGSVVGGGQYDYGQSCTLTAYANSGYTFSHWTRNGTAISGGATISFTVAGDATYVAYFTFNGDHAYVDLGLPSGLLWATCNVGANAPEDYGDYFAWGETQPKDYYDWSTYQYSNNGSFVYPNLTKYCFISGYGYNGFTDNLTTLLPEDDAATANWGSDWRMPTKEEWQELYNNTTVTWTTQNGVNGRLFTAANGNSLFLPAAGYRYLTSLYSAGGNGNYWSSSLDTVYPYTPELAWAFYFGSVGYDVASAYRFMGRSVRPVRSVQN